MKILLSILILTFFLSSCSEPVSPYMDPENGCYSETSRAINFSQNREKYDFTYDRFCINNKIVDDKNQLFLSCEAPFISWLRGPTFIIFTVKDMTAVNNKTEGSFYVGLMETFNFIVTQEDKQILLSKPKSYGVSCPNEACTSYEIITSPQITLDRATLELKLVRNKTKYNEITGRYYESLEQDTEYSSCNMHDKKDFIEHIDDINQAKVQEIELKELNKLKERELKELKERELKELRERSAPYEI